MTLTASHNGAQILNYSSTNQNLPIAICFWSKPSFIDLPEYNINSKTISKVVKIKDLGIILSLNLNWDYHYKKFTSRAYKFLDLLRRDFYN